MAYGDLEKLTRGERLAIQRRRLGERQRVAAVRHGVPLSRYSRWERDLEHGPSVRIGVLKVHEQCFIYRRRSGKTQAQIASDLGMCRYWLNRVELGLANCDDLVGYWEA